MQNKKILLRQQIWNQGKTLSQNYLDESSEAMKHILLQKEVPVEDFALVVGKYLAEKGIFLSFL